MAKRDKTPMTSNYWKLLGASAISNLGDGIGMIAYPWLASAVTRNPILISLVVVMQRLPWLVFSLPAGVITDRVDRRKLLIGANWARAALTAVVALGVLGKQGVLPSPAEIEAGLTSTGTNMTLYGLVLVATLLLGVAEVLYDNAGQTFLPSIVPSAQLEKANGRMWSAEMVANTFAGPPLGAVLLLATFSLPFFVDAATFAISAVLITLIPAAVSARPEADEPLTGDEAAPSWIDDLKEGFSWLWNHDLLRPMAIILGLLNMLGAISLSILILFAQEVLNVSPAEFAIMGTGGAIGGVVGGWAASAVAAKLGSGPSLALTLLAGGTTSIVTGLSSHWPVVWVMTAIATFTAVLWNVITVSLRQAIIPDQLLGRVNSVYRFFAWGMIPVGAFLGGLIVTVSELDFSRELALRMPWLIAGIGHFVLLLFAAPRLTTANIEAARNSSEPK